MEKIIVKPLYHREQECIGIYFEKQAKINGALRKHTNARWSQTNKCWYLPLNKEAYNKIAFAMRGLAEIDNAALRQYLLEKKKRHGSRKQSHKGFTC
jgi:hypothetical protein